MNMDECIYVEMIGCECRHGYGYIWIYRNVININICMFKCGYTATNVDIKPGVLTYLWW